MASSVGSVLLLLLISTLLAFAAAAGMYFVDRAQDAREWAARDAASAPQLSRQHRAHTKPAHGATRANAAAR